MAARKITRKQMKQDKFVSSVFSVYNYARNNQNIFIIAVVVLVVIIIGIFGFLSYQKSKKQDAVNLLGIAMFEYRQSQFTASRDSLISLTEKYPGTPSGKVGFYYLGHLRMMLAEYEEALINLERFLSDPVEDDDLIAAATRMLAGCYEEKGEYDKAAELYEDVIKKYPDFFETEEAYIGAARCYWESKEYAKATELYKEFLDKYDDSYRKEDVKLALVELEKREEYGTLSDIDYGMQASPVQVPTNPQQRQGVPVQGGTVPVQPGETRQLEITPGQPGEVTPVSPTAGRTPAPPPAPPAGETQTGENMETPSPTTPGDLVPEEAPPADAGGTVPEGTPGENENPPDNTGE
ncbi:tetratricopeptide repeat protein [bacterium]|nr:tetratricopeptide repeat protein [bacterium]